MKTNKMPEEEDEEHVPAADSVTNKSISEEWATWKC